MVSRFFKFFIHWQCSGDSLDFTGCLYGRRDKMKNGTGQFLSRIIFIASVHTFNKKQPQVHIN